MTVKRTTQVAVEAILSPNPHLRTTQVAVEVIVQPLLSRHNRFVVIVT